MSAMGNIRLVHDVQDAEPIGDVTNRILKQAIMLSRENGYMTDAEAETAIERLGLRWA